MSKGSGGSRGGLTGDSNYKGKISNVETLKNMKHNDAYKAIVHAISRYHSVLGVREQNVKLADLGAGTMGVQSTDVLTGKSEGVYLAKSYFKNKTSAQIADSMKGMYKSAWQTKTNQPVAHVITHELAHATWNTSLKSKEAQAATPEIRKLYRAWSRDKGTDKLGYGKYSHSNINEFWAEASTKAVHGVADKYTTAIKGIIKKYKL